MHLANFLMLVTKQHIFYLFYLYFLFDEIVNKVEQLNHIEKNNNRTTWSKRFLKWQLYDGDPPAESQDNVGIMQYILYYVHEFNTDYCT